MEGGKEAMRTAAIYCRVSTEDQEKEGTSLQTQLDSCLDYCRDKGYDVRYRFSEAYSGLTLDRPKLDELRELVRASNIDVIIVYCLDRLSRDPTHGVILTQELEKHNVTLEAVTETVDSSELGKLISYIRGFASKLEAEKIRERTMRGKKAKAKQGRIPGGGVRLYGYHYIKAAYDNGGRRVINQDEAKWVHQMFEWLVRDGLSTTAITHRLRALDVPRPSGNGHWIKSTVQRILRNVAYTGKTYAFTATYAEPRYRTKPDTKRRLTGRIAKPKYEWIEIPDATPAIISQELFDAAQKQLQINRRKAKRNVRREYLLHGHVYCRQCGRAYWSGIATTYLNGKRYQKRRYRCSGSQRIVSPVNQCRNKGWSANTLEPLVWEQLKRVLNNPDLIVAEMEKQRQDANQLGVLEAELQQVERHLKALDREQEQLLQWALKGFPEQTIVAENKRINERRTSLQTQKTELEAQIKASQGAAVSLPKLEHLIELMRDKLSSLDYETKRLALDMLNIKVWLDGQNVEITGTLPIADDAIVTTQSRAISQHPVPPLALGGNIDFRPFNGIGRSSHRMGGDGSGAKA